MPILMKHSGNAAAAAAGEYGAGQGKRSWEGMNAELAQQRQQENADHANAIQQSNELDRRSWELRSANMAQDRQQANIDYTYSAQQRAEYNKLAEAGAQAESSGLFTPDELIDVRREIIAKQAGMKPLPRMSKTSAFPPDRGIGKSWTSDDGAVVMTRDEKGQEKVLYKTEAAPTIKDTAELYKQAQAALTRTVGADTVMPKPEEIEAYVTNAFALHQKLRAKALGKEALADPNAPLNAALATPQDDQLDTKGMAGIPGVGLPGASPAGQPDLAVIEDQTAKIIATLPPEQAKIVSALVPKNADQARNQERMLATLAAVHADYPLWPAAKKRAEVKKRMEKEFGVTDL
jgi:hypothetical protein